MIPATLEKTHKISLVRLIHSRISYERPVYYPAFPDMLHLKAASTAGNSRHPRCDGIDTATIGSLHGLGE